MLRSSFRASRQVLVACLAVCVSCSLAYGQARSVEDKKAVPTEQEKVRGILDRIRKLQKEPAPAEDISKTPAAQAAGRIAETTNRLDALRKLESSQERAFNEFGRSVDRTALAPPADIVYPKDWQARSEARASSLVTMTAKEKTILRALESPISLQFKNARLESVLDYLRDKTGLPLLADRTALTAADVNYDSTVSFDAKGVSVRTVLRKILADLGLTYVIRNEAIQIVTPEMARQMQVTRVYYARDLLPGGWGYFSAIQAALLIDLIQSTVEPDSWKVNGGDGTILYDPVRRALVVKQSAEFHSALSGGALSSR